MKDNKKVAIIIGAGPAGLTAGLELLRKTDIQPIIFEASDVVGGISRTVNYKGNKIDIGSHRFFSKSEKITKWWYDILFEKDYKKNDKVLLEKNRITRIFYLQKFFDYPISLNWQTLKNLGFWRVFKIAFSYLKIRLFPIKEEKSLEDFFINRFGRELYLTFFKDYTEKIWGVKCSEISSDWGRQRIKSLSISKALIHALKSFFKKDDKNVETSLIGKFLYPKLGAGQMWEEVAKRVKKKGGKIYLNNKVVSLSVQDNKVAKVAIKDLKTNQIKYLEADYVFSTMPVRNLIRSIKKSPEKVRQVSDGLVYRDFITIGVLLKKMKIKNQTKIKTLNNIIPDNWIYIQEKGVKLGRIQFFNNWSEYLLADKNKVWIGLEYFCNEGDEFWRKQDRELIEIGLNELEKINIAEKKDFLDGTVIRMPKAYPAYFGSYKNFDVIKNYVNKIENLFLIGRNGMHRYNNMDHSMLTAMLAVDNIVNNIKTKENIWQVNTEQEYHESK